MATGLSSSPSSRTTVSVRSATPFSFRPTAARPSGVVILRLTASGDAPGGESHAHRTQLAGGGRGCPPDPGEHRLDVRIDELAVAADPRASELERDRNGVVVRGADGNVLDGDVRRLRHERPRPRRLSIVEDAEVDVRDRGARPVGPLDDEHGRPELEVVALRDLVQLVAPAAGRDPHGRRDVGPPDAGAHAAHCGGGPQLGRATNSVGRTTSEGAAAVAHAGKQELGSGAAHREVVTPDDGDTRLEELRDRDVVAADERRGPRPSVTPRSDDDAERSQHQLVSARDHRRRRLRPVEQRAHRGGAVLDREGALVDA